MSVDTVMREAFEEDAMLSFRPGTSISRDACGEYEDSTVADHWETWQTAWAEAVKSAPVASAPVLTNEDILLLVCDHTGKRISLRVDECHAHIDFARAIIARITGEGEE